MASSIQIAQNALPMATFVRYQPGRDNAEATRVTVTIKEDGHRIGLVAALLHKTTAGYERQGGEVAGDTGSV